MTSTNRCLQCLAAEKADPIRHAKELERWRKNNILRDPKKHVEDVVLYGKRHPEKIKYKNRLYYERHKESVLARNRARYHANLEKEHLRKKIWRIKNPDEYKRVTKVQYNKRRNRLKNTDGTFTVADIRFLEKVQKCRCANCGKNVKTNYHVDHIIPLARGGSNGRGNLQLLCPPCNMRKGAHDPIVWAQRQGRLL